MDTAIQPAPVVVSLKEWIRATSQLSSKEAYLLSAANVSWMLARRLLEVLPLATASLGEIATERVLVVLEPRCSLMNVQLADASIQAIHFQFEAQAANIFSGGQVPMGGGASAMPTRALCAVLGNVLLEVFTMGRSSAIEASADRNAIFTRASSLMTVLETPMAVRRLVGDLLHAINDPCPKTALASVEEVLWDLTYMKDEPRLFLFDRTCPLGALVDTCLFVNTERHLFGREDVIAQLMSAKKRVSDHVLLGVGTQAGNAMRGQGGAFCQETNFFCEMVSLHGYAGSGKSRLLQSLINACNHDGGWLVLNFKHDPQLAQQRVVVKGYDDFFWRWSRPDADPAMKEVVRQICQSITATIDDETTLRELCDMFPNLGKNLPQISAGASWNRDQGYTNEGADNLSSSERTTGSLIGERTTGSLIGEVGSASRRRTSLYHVLFKAILAVGRPVLFTHDDVQWAQTFDGLQDLIAGYHNIPCATQSPGNHHHGLMIATTFRSNEMREDDGVMQNIKRIEQDRSVNAARIAVRDLGKDHITQLLATKLCLPTRYTKDLAGLVFAKTRGNVYFILQFLKSVIENRMLAYVVNARRWDWDLDVIDMKMISQGVAELLTARFSQLPLPLIHTVKIASCFGSQVEGSTLAMVNFGHQVPFNMREILRSAVTEGLMDRAGDVFQFNHDYIQQTIYELIPPENRRALHRCIGTSLLQASINNKEHLLLAVDQLNKYCSVDAVLGPEESSSFAEANASAAKHAIASSSFEQARSYIDVGLRLLKNDPHHWSTQYNLSLELYELSASVSYLSGNTAAMGICLNEILPNLQSFTDSITSSILLSKLLASSSKYDEALINCRSALSNLGEEDLPANIDLPLVMNELAVIETTLNNITVDQVKQLPRMTDTAKLSAMQFMNMMCRYCTIAKPKLVPILSCRMVRMTIEDGFCDDSIVGLAVAGWALFVFKENVQLGYRIGQVCDALIDESPKKHALRARLCKELDVQLKALVEPQQKLIPVMNDRYNSSMLSGDVESAVICLTAQSALAFYTGANLLSTSKAFKNCIEQASRYQQQNQLLVAMTNLRMCTHLTGRSEDGIGLLSLDELQELGESTTPHLRFRVFMSRMSNLFFDRDWIAIMELSKKRPEGNVKRILHTGIAWYEGVASLNLARQTNQSKWRDIGLSSVEKLAELTQTSKHNFEHRSLMLQAELYYVDGDLDSAEAAYEASIKSAREHQFLNEEAVALELYGVFCIENKSTKKGARLLRDAVKTYERWGAKRKSDELKLLVDTVDKGC